MNKQTTRQAEPHEDDLCIQRIEIEFAIPVYLPIPAKGSQGLWEFAGLSEPQP